MNRRIEITPADLTQVGRSALQLEAAAIKTFADNLGGEFVRAVELLCQPEGRTIVTGIGKSGHVARKIASTLSSIGRPAFFVHPSEASHGDLGMIVDGDVMVALSKSGESTELSDMVSYCQASGIPMIALVGDKDSTLARHARVVLAYGNVPEVCAIGMAPTTSTTLAMAIGDALAVGVMSVLGTTAAHFRKWHPGGKLGAALLTVSDIMHRGDAVPFVSPSMLMQEVVIVMSAKGFGVAVVRDEDGAVLGVITDGDMRRHAQVLWQSRAGDLVTGRPLSIASGILASEALAIMTERKVTSLIVEDAPGGDIGLLHIHDCLRAGL